MRELLTPLQGGVAPPVFVMNQGGIVGSSGGSTEVRQLCAPS